MESSKLERLPQVQLEPRIFIYSEWPIEYYGGGERLMVMLLESFRSLGYKTKIIDNSNNNAISRINRNFLIEKYGESIKSSVMKKYGFFKTK